VARVRVASSLAAAVFADSQVKAGGRGGHPLEVPKRDPHALVCAGSASNNDDGAFIAEQSATKNLVWSWDRVDGGRFHRIAYRVVLLFGGMGRSALMNLRIWELQDLACSR